MNTWQLYDEPRAFAESAGVFLREHALPCTVIASMVDRLLAGEVQSVRRHRTPYWFATVDAPGRSVAAVAMRSGDWPPIMTGVDAAAARELAQRITERGERPQGANGSPEAARAFCERLVQEWGGQIETKVSTRLFRLDSLRPPQNVPGLARPAELADVDRLVDFLDAFHDEAAPGSPHANLSPADRRRECQRYIVDRMDTGGQWVWEVEGEVVSCAATRSPAYGFARIGPVYTPPAQRGRGYAAGVTAAVSQAILDQDATPCLFTDLSNPTSNGVYQRIGFVPVEDTVNLLVVEQD